MVVEFESEQIDEGIYRLKRKGLVIGCLTLKEPYHQLKNRILKLE